MQKLVQNVSFGRNLQRLRKRRGLSQADILRELQLRGRSMSRTNYAHIEQGIRSIFVSDLILLKDILQVSYEVFLRGFPHPFSQLKNDPHLWAASIGGRADPQLWQSIAKLRSL